MTRTAVLLLALLAAFPTPAQPPVKGRKVAFLVGVGTFKHNLAPLKGGPEKDVAALEKELKAAGFEVVTLTGEKATKAEIEGRLDALLKGNGDPKKTLGQADVLLVALCSHGFTMEVTDPVTKANVPEPFVAGYDARPGDAGTMVNLNGLIRTATPFGVSAYFLVDACREVADPNRGATRGIEGQQMTLPAKTAVLFSCGRGQVAYQPDAIGHGLFTFAVLKALRGDTGLSGDASWADLVSHVGKSFRSAEFKKHMPAGKPQSPVEAKGETEDAPLFALAAKPPAKAAVVGKADPPGAGVVGDMVKGERAGGAVVECEIADGVKMVFCWVPKGDCQLGSPKAEADRAAKAGFTGSRTGLRDEQENVRAKYASAGFWLGKYEVTQTEWKAVMGNNPSQYDRVRLEKEKEKAKDADTSRFPVDSVTWPDCQKFMQKVNEGGRGGKAFGTTGAFVLPDEDEWEYACRGGRRVKSAYHFGDALNGTQANCNGKLPFGTATAGPSKARTEEVGWYEKKGFKHPWGLCDMHGNVQEWCENTTPAGDRYAVRGGMFSQAAHLCRAAAQSYHAPTAKFATGFRVCFRPE